MSVLLVKLGSVLGLSMASGINLYATVAVVGLAAKFDLVRGLPAEFEAFNNDFVIGLALVLYACEFLADKIPAFDSLWDSVHTVIRPFGAALIAVTVVGKVDPGLQIAAGLLGTSLGLITHTAKTGTRLAVNTSPEPFSNIALSLGEDAAVFGFTWLVLTHPYLSLAASLVLLALLFAYGPGLWRGALLVARAVPVRLAVTLSRSDAEPVLVAFLPDAIARAVTREITRPDATSWRSDHPAAVPRLDKNGREVSSTDVVRAAVACHARRVRGSGRNRRGWLVLTDRRLLFAYHSLFQARTRVWELSDLENVELTQRFLVDVLRVRSRDRLLSFLFLKNCSREAAVLRERVEEATRANVSRVEPPLARIVSRARSSRRRPTVTAHQESRLRQDAG